jgi:hypothetical protein
MEGIEATMVTLIPATRAMLGGTLGAALAASSPPPAYEAPPLGTRRAMVLSGMYGAEVVSVIQAYQEAGACMAAEMSPAAVCGGHPSCGLLCAAAHRP